MNSVLAGLLAGALLAITFAIYIVIRKASLVKGFRQLDDSIAGLTQQTLFILILAGFLLAALLFGVISGLVYGWIGLPLFYYVAFGAALLLSLAAVISKTPMAVDKIFWNVAVGLVLGVTVPLFAA